MHLTSAAARAVSLKLVEQHPDALVPAQVIRLPGVEARYQPAVRLRFGSRAPDGLAGVTILEAIPPPPLPPAKKQKPPKADPPIDRPKRPHRKGQREKAIALLRRPEGITSPELAAALGVQPQTARSLLSRMSNEFSIEHGRDHRYRVER